MFINDQLAISRKAIFLPHRDQSTWTPIRRRSTRWSSDTTCRWGVRVRIATTELDRSRWSTVDRWRRDRLAKACRKANRSAHYCCCCSGACCSWSRAAYPSSADSWSSAGDGDRGASAKSSSDGGSRDGADGEVKCSTRQSPTAGCWKLARWRHCPAPAGTAGPSHTTKIHCSYHLIHCRSVELLSRFRCFPCPCSAWVWACIWARSDRRRTRASSLNTATIAGAIGSLAAVHRTRSTTSADDA